MSQKLTRAVLLALSLTAFVGRVAAAEPPTNAFGIPIAPESGMASIHQWGGVDDQFAVNPDEGQVPATKPHHMAAPKDDADSEADANEPEGEDPDHFDEILPV
jgi:hypothetical protein